MTNQDQKSAAIEFLDVAFNQGEPEKAVSQYVGKVTFNTIRRFRMAGTH